MSKDDDEKADITGVVNAVTADGEKLKKELEQKRRRLSGQFKLLFEQLKKEPLPAGTAAAARGSIPDR